MTARHDEGFFTAKDQLRLFWTLDVPAHPRAHVVVVHGYADHIGRYRATIDALVAEGFAVHGFDYRGHGRADGRRGACERWTDYVDDLGLLWERARKAAGAQKLFLLGHSHGGLMAVHLLARGASGLAGLVLSAPYFKLAIIPPATKLMLARVVGLAVPWLPIKSELTPDSLSRDPAIQQAVREDPLYNTVVTPRWFVQSTQAQLEAMALAPQVKVPLFVLTGSEDGVAAPAAARTFFEAAGASDKKFKEYPGMRHEPLNELGREEVVRDISGWISSHL